jgi:hypothetical protein
MKNPRSWDDVFGCECNSCRCLQVIYEQCHRHGKFLFVMDCRMYGAEFCVCDLRLVFRGVATLVRGLQLDEATRMVIYEQSHCDAFVSSYPALHGADYLWAVQTSVEATPV